MIAQEPLAHGITELSQAVAWVEEQIDALAIPGLALAERALTEFYPERPSYVGSGVIRELFCYQFMSTEGRNIANWIPRMKAISMIINEYSPRGRPYASSLIQGSDSIAPWMRHNVWTGS